MRLPLTRLLVRSPLPGVATLMRRVVTCSEHMPALIDALIAGDQQAVHTIARDTSRAEGLADQAKNEVRAALPMRLFLPVDRRDLLRLVSEIDAIADASEDVGVLLTLRTMEVPEPMRDLLVELVRKVMDTVHAAETLIGTLNPLLEVGFGGRAVKRAKAHIDELHRQEHEADKLQDQLAKILFQMESELSPVAILMWMKILNKLGDIANHAENVGDQFRLFIAR